MSDTLTMAEIEKLEKTAHRRTALSMCENGSLRNRVYVDVSMENGVWHKLLAAARREVARRLRMEG